MPFGNGIKCSPFSSESSIRRPPDVTLTIVHPRALASSRICSVSAVLPE